MRSFVRSLTLVLPLATAALACGKSAPSAPPPDGRREIRITVDARGYHPAEAQAPANTPLRLVFTRTTDEGCGQQLAFPTLNLRRDLPLNEAVPVDVTTPASGRLAFTCGMDMYRGAIVVE